MRGTNIKNMGKCKKTAVNGGKSLGKCRKIARKCRENAGNVME